MSPFNAVEISRGEGVEIHTIAVGDPQGSGENRVNLATLQEIARRTGGAYFFACDVKGLDEVHARIDELSPRVTDVLSYRPRTLLGHFSLGLAAVLGLAMLMVLTHRRKRAARA